MSVTDTPPVRLMELAIACMCAAAMSFTYVLMRFSGETALGCDKPSMYLCSADLTFCSCMDRDGAATPFVWASKTNLRSIIGIDAVDRPYDLLYAVHHVSWIIILTILIAEAKNVYRYMWPPLMPEEME